MKTAGSLQHNSFYGYMPQRPDQFRPVFIRLKEEKDILRFLFKEDEEQFSDEYDLIENRLHFQLQPIPIFRQVKVRKAVQHTTEENVKKIEDEKESYQDLKYTKDFSTEFVLIFTKIVQDMEISGWRDPDGNVIMVWKELTQKVRA
ncbi:MAG: hypothetical protein JXR30_00145 [Alphaproteobacteria bacterium]|nr:hypothetical protein [Alphaproteobacteria bacterium]